MLYRFRIRASFCKVLYLYGSLWLQIPLGNVPGGLCLLTPAPAPHAGRSGSAFGQGVAGDIDGYADRPPPWRGEACRAVFASAVSGEGIGFRLAEDVFAAFAVEPLGASVHSPGRQKAPKRLA